MKTKSRSTKSNDNNITTPKSSITKKTSKKVNKIIEPEIDETNDNDDKYISFGKLYAKMVSMICHYFIHHDDGACDYDYTGKREVFQYENTHGMKIMYNPAKPDGWVERAALLLMIPKNIRLNNQKKIKDQINYVNGLLVEDFNNFMKLTNNRFYNVIEKDVPDQNDILQIYHKFQKNDQNSWILKFNLGESCHYFWRPLQVIKYCKDLEEWDHLKHMTPEEMNEKYGHILKYFRENKSKSEGDKETKNEDKDEKVKEDEEETEDEEKTEEEDKEEEYTEYTDPEYIECIKNGPEFKEISLFSDYRQGFNTGVAKVTLEV